MNRTMITVCVTAALGLAGLAVAQTLVPMSPATPLSKDGYAAATKDAEARFRIDKEARNSLSANAGGATL